MSQTRLPEWAATLASQYESGAVSQFILHGNLQDRFLAQLAGRTQLVNLTEYLVSVLLPRFDVVLSYDLGNGVRIEKGGDHMSRWPGYSEQPDLPKAPRAAIEWLSRFLRYTANLGRLGKEQIHVACIVKAANLLVPSGPASSSPETGALALLMRDWSSEASLTEHALATFLLTENLSDLHPLLATNSRASRLKLPLPATGEVEAALEFLAPRFPVALQVYKDQLPALAGALTGISLNAIESLLKLKQHRGEVVRDTDLVALKKQLVEDECQGLIEFIESRRTLDDVHGQDALKVWLRQDLALWQKGDARALPMGYLICGPVGTGKTYLVNCLAGEAGVPVVKIRNFRDRWVGSTEGNLEKIFRLLAALNRCYVFIDEADQALGRRDSGSNDSGLSGRIYSMIAAEMSRPENRGRIVWILASSRPDLIEVDLKRPGRVDVKLPIFPTSTPEESWALLQQVARRFDLPLANVIEPEILQAAPTLLTPGAAEALALKIYRKVQTSSEGVDTIVRDAFTSYRPMVAREVMDAQIALAIAECSDPSFVPEAFRA